MSFLDGKVVQVTADMVVGFDTDGGAIVNCRPGSSRPPDPAALVHQRQQQLATELAVLTLWLRQVEGANQASRLVVLPPGARLPTHLPR